MSAQGTITSPAVSPGIFPRTILVHGPEQRTLALNHRPFSVGRKMDKDLVIADPRVSRDHALLVSEDGKVFVEDQGSKLGTFVNGGRVERKQLEPNDRVEFGARDTIFAMFHPQRDTSNTARHFLSQISEIHISITSPRGLRMRSSLLLVFLLFVKCGVGQAISSGTPKTENQDDLARIVGYSMMSGGASKFLETLSDNIGGRITGSPESKATAELLLRTLKDAGFDNAHFEEYTINPGWQHGPAMGAVISPVKRDLYVASYGWAPGTPGPVEVPVVDMGASGDGHSPLPDQVRGAAVLVDVGSNGLSTNYVATRHLLARQLASAGAAAMFIVSDKPDRMLYTSAFLIYPRGPLPIVSIAKEDAAFLRRLLNHGPVKIRLDIQNSFSDGPVAERNVVADLAGKDPSEMVLLTAHFDSWDPAQGANDNGGEVATVLEAARILKELKIEPRHTIRFVFFSGEEQSDLGSRAYAAQHKQELDKVRAAFNTDAGIQTPLGLKLYGRTDLQAMTKRLMAPLAPLGMSRVFTESDFDSDEESFMVVGVPAYSLAVEPDDYYARHHTIIDTFERIDPRMLSVHTAVLAAIGYIFANTEERPGRRLSSDEVKQLLKRTGLESLYELDYPQAKPY